VVDFTPKTNFDPNAQNWTGSSRGPERKDYQVNRTFETLFSGIGDTITGVTKTAYEGIVDTAKKAWEADFEPTRDAQGVGDFRDNMDANRAAQKSGMPPPEKESYAKRAAKLQDAFGEGRIGATYYYSQLTSMAKEMRAKFPGFGDEVDAIIQKSTGVVPANALRLSILDELQANRTAAQKAADDDAKWVDSKAQHMTPEMLARVQRGEKISRKELEPVVYEAEARDYQLKTAKAQLEFEASKGTNVSTEAAQRFQDHLETSFSATMKQAMSVVGGNLQELMNKIAAGKDLSPQELDQVKVGIAVLKQETRRQFETIAGHRTREGGLSYESMINDPNKTKNIIDRNMAKIDELERLLTNNELGPAAMLAKSIEYGSNARYRKLLDQNQFARNWETMNRLPGFSEFIKIAVGQQGGVDILNEGLRVAKETLLVQAGSGTGSMDSMVKTAEAATGSRDNPGFYKSVINDYARILSDDKVTPEIRKNFVTSLFGDQHSLNVIKGPQKEKAFSILTSPDIQKQMMKIRDLGDTESWERYSAWVKSSFTQVHRELMQDVGDASSQRFLDVRFEGDKNQFKIYLTPEGTRQVSGSMRAANNASANPLERLAANNSSISTYIQKVDSLNKAIKLVEPVMKADNYEFSQEMFNLLKSRGMDTQQPKEPRLEQKIFGAIKNWFTSEGKPVDNPAVATFGGEEVGFQSASGGNKGTGSQVSLDGSTVTNNRGADLQNLDQRTKKFLDDLASDGVVETIDINSGYRDPARNARAGGAKASKHMDGLAVDINVSGMTDEQKSAVLEAAIRRGAKGIGIYPGGNAIHLDLRNESPSTWGFSPFGRYKGVDWSEQPAWAHGPLKKLFGVREAGTTKPGG